MLWQIVVLLPAVRADPCDRSAAQAFKHSDENATCRCHGAEGEHVTSLLNSADNKVAGEMLEPGDFMPGTMQSQRQAQYWDLQKQTMDLKTITGCPEGYKSRQLFSNEAPPPGSYWDIFRWWAIREDLSTEAVMKRCMLLRQCPHGFYCPQVIVENSVPPRACGKGKLCDRMNLSEPLPCPVGYFCPTSLVKTECRLGFHCPQETYVPKLCTKGYACATPCDQTKCPEGFWCPEGTSVPKKCSWWSKCPEGAVSENWWALGLTLAIAVPTLFEMLLGLAFRRQVHEQVAVAVPKGMTLPCAMLMLSSLGMGWLLMPSVALVKTGVFLYTIISATDVKLLRIFRLVLLLGFACLVYVLFGFFATAWMLYILSSVFIGFLCNSPQLVNRRRGVLGLCALFISLTSVNGVLLMTGVRMGTDGAHGATKAALLWVGHALMFAFLLLYLSCAEIQRHLLPAPEGVDRLPGISFRLENVGLAVGSSQKAVLRDISLEIEGDSSCALMGPSGSGKSSLLNVLTGRALLYGEVSGRVFANGELIPEGIEGKAKNATGFVPQDDVMHTDLTVYENVYFSARLRLPPDTMPQEVVATVEQVLKDVGIWHVKDTPIGNAELRGISGGQRKRASIAMELVGRPSVLFLDEPTSGLDASAAHAIIKLICDKSELRCTCIAVIHQPRWQTLTCFDQVVLLATGGYLVYSGPVRDSVTYFTQVLHLKLSEGDNPADLFLDFIGAEAARSPQDIASEWTCHLPMSTRSSDRPQLPLAAYEKTRPGVSETFWILCLRCSLQVCRLRSLRVTNLCLLALFLLLMRILLGEGGDFEDVLMQLGIGQSMLMLPVCIHCLHIFNRDRLERQREDIAGIPALSQYLAKDFCHFVEMLLFAAVWTGIYGPYSHLGVSPSMMLRVSVAQSYLAFGISHLLSLSMPSQSTATVTLMLFLVIAQLCSGVDMISYKDMYKSLLGVGWVIFILSPSFYTVQRFIPIMLADAMTPPVRDAACNGYLQQKGVACDRPSEAHLPALGRFINPHSTLLADMSNSYIFLSDDTQLVMLGLAVRAIALLQMQLQAVGFRGWQKGLSRLALSNAAVFLVLTIPVTYNLHSSWL